MFLTIKEFQDQIQLTKRQLVEAAVVWLDTQRAEISDKDRENWLEAFRASNKEDMQQILRERGFPLLRVVETLSVPLSTHPEAEASSSSLVLAEEPVTEDSLLIPKSVYQCNANKESEMLIKLSHLTTLMEQLHLLDELAQFIDSHIDFRGLKLAYDMTHAINKEWRNVEAGRETIAYYNERLQTANQQFEYSRKQSFNSMDIYRSQVEYRIKHVQMVLEFFGESLNQTFSLVSDSRMWIVRMFAPRLPWHAMLNEVGANMLGQNGITTPTKDTLQVQASGLQELAFRFEELQRAPFVSVASEYQTKVQNVEDEKKIVERNLDAMAKELDVVLTMATQRRSGMSLLPTQFLPVYGFYRSIYAALGSTRFQNAFISTGDEIDPDGTQNRVDYDRTYHS